MPALATNRFKTCFGSWVSSALPLFIFSGFVLVSLYAKYSPVQGGETPKATPVVVPQKKTEVDGKAKPKKTKTEETKAVVGPIPGAGKKLDFHDLAKVIDSEVSRRLAAEGFKPSPRTDDAEFLRRVYLDLIGVIPTADKVEAFLKAPIRKNAKRLSRSF